MLALNHFRRRKQKAKSVSTHKFLDKIIFLAAVVGPIMTIPQIINIWVQKSTEGVSLYTFGSYLLLNFVWLYYGLVHRDRAIIFAYLMWILANSTVVIGLLLYG